MCVIISLFYCNALCLQDLASPSLSEDDIQQASKSLLNTPVANILGKTTEC